MNTIFEHVLSLSFSHCFDSSQTTPCPTFSTIAMILSRFASIYTHPHTHFIFHWHCFGYLLHCTLDIVVILLGEDHLDLDFEPNLCRRAVVAVFLTSTDRDSAYTYGTSTALYCCTPKRSTTSLVLSCAARKGLHLVSKPPQHLDVSAISSVLTPPAVQISL